MSASPVGESGARRGSKTLADLGVSPVVGERRGSKLGLGARRGSLAAETTPEEQMIAFAKIALETLKDDEIRTFRKFLQWLPSAAGARQPGGGFFQSPVGVEKSDKVKAGRRSTVSISIAKKDSDNRMAEVDTVKDSTTNTSKALNRRWTLEISMSPVDLMPEIDKHKLGLRKKLLQYTN